MKILFAAVMAVTNRFASKYGCHKNLHDRGWTWRIIIFDGYLLPYTNIVDNPDVEVSELVNEGEYRWIKVPQSFMSNWEKFHDPIIGSCANTENPLTNKKWILICQEVYWKVS